MILIKFLNYFKTDIFRQSNKRIIQNEWRKGTERRNTTQHKKSDVLRTMDGSWEGYRIIARRI